MGKIRGEIGGEITGTVGDVTISVWKGLKIAKRKRGASSKPPSDAMKDQRERFRLASLYARSVKADAVKRKKYEALSAGTLNSWRSLAVKDYLLPPIINHVDVSDYSGRAGGRVDIQIDDVTVEKVHVKILNPDVTLPNGTKTDEPLGALVEQGDAVRSAEGQDFQWVYRAQKDLTGAKFVLVIEADDLPGNNAMTKLEGDV